MSVSAPWIALSIDWMDSDLFDGGATDGERLAWVYLLCHAKAQGRAGVVRVRKSAFIRQYQVSERAFDGIVEKAQKCGSITVDGDTIHICNWPKYQHKASKAPALKGPEYTENSGNSGNSGKVTNNTVQITDHRDKSQEQTTGFADAENESEGSAGKPDKILWSPENGWQNITDHHRQAWAKAYPACDIDRQLAQMHAWLLANPTKRKVNNARFITNWLKREQDRGGDQRGGGKAGSFTAGQRRTARQIESDRGEFDEDIQLRVTKI